jgi:hypothetical protein
MKKKVHVLDERDSLKMDLSKKINGWFTLPEFLRFLALALSESKIWEEERAKRGEYHGSPHLILLDLLEHFVIPMSSETVPNILIVDGIDDLLSFWGGVGWCSEFEYVLHSFREVGRFTNPDDRELFRRGTLLLYEISQTFLKIDSIKFAEIGYPPKED